MSQNTPTLHRIFLSLIVLFLVGYGLFNSRFLIKGPQLAIAGLEDSEQNILHAQTRDFSLQGTVLHSSFITVNNRPILVDESGNFNEKLLLSSGVSIIDIYARDKFGKEVRKKIDVVYTGESPSLGMDEYTKIALRAQQASSSQETAQEDLEESDSEVSASASFDQDTTSTRASSTTSSEL